MGMVWGNAQGDHGKSGSHGNTESVTYRLRRTARAVFHERLVEYWEHYEACVDCQLKIEGYPAGDVDTRLSC